MKNLQGHFAQILTSLDTSQAGAVQVRDTLSHCSATLNEPEEWFAWATCVLALQAVTKGSFGIGSVLVDAEGTILQAGHNEVFSGGFRSDLHAEMVVITRYEERQSGRMDLRDCTLYTSLESCPMCLCRLITSGVGRVFYVAADDIGGMVRRKDSLPPVWRELMDTQVHCQATCSDILKQAAHDIFLLNVEDLNQKLKQ